VPVVAARVGGIPEVVDDGKSAMLADAPAADALAGALSRALTTPGWRESASACALARAHAQFGRERYARRYFDLYTSLISQQSAA
jgi:glycosyltransferase involved in cell wall biosynthesis